MLLIEGSLFFREDFPQIAKQRSSSADA